MYWCKKNYKKTLLYLTRMYCALQSGVAGIYAVHTVRVSTRVWQELITFQMCVCTNCDYSNKQSNKREYRTSKYLFQSFLAVFLRGRDEFTGGDRGRRASRLRRGRLWLQLGGNYKIQKAQNICYKIHFLRVVCRLYHIMLLFWWKRNQHATQRSGLRYLAKISHY